MSYPTLISNVNSEIVAKLKKQNAKLREELKQLSEQLSTILEKQKAKRPEKPVVNQDLAKGTVQCIITRFEWDFQRN